MSDKVVRLVHSNSVQEEAAAWIARIDREGARPELVAEFEAWQAQSPRHAQAAQELAALWIDLDDLAKTAPARPASASGRRRVLAAGAAMAASVALAAGLWMAQRPAASPTLYDAPVGTHRVIALDDGSKIDLNTGGQVEVRYTGTTRDIRLLKGEAYFEVAPDAARPFSVYAQSGVVRALGTAFAVRLDGDEVEVTLTKGVIELAKLDVPASLEQASAAPRRRLATLSAAMGAESATIAPDGGLSREAGAEEADRKLAWRRGMLVFAGETLPEVVADVSRYTDMDIEIADPALNDLRVAGNFKAGEVEAMLEALQTGFGVRVERAGDKRVRLSAGS